MAISCKNCGAQLDDDDRFCIVCGTAVAAAPESQSYSAPPEQQQYYAPPEQQQYNAQPEQQQQYQQTPEQQQYYATPEQQQYNTPPEQQQYYAPPEQQYYAQSAPKKGLPKNILLIIIIAAAAAAAVIIFVFVLGDKEEPVSESPPVVAEDIDEDDADDSSADDTDIGNAPSTGTDESGGSGGTEGPSTGGDDFNFSEGWPADKLPPGLPEYPGGTSSYLDSNDGMTIIIDGTDRNTRDAYIVTLNNAGWEISPFNEDGDATGDNGTWVIYIMFFEPDSVMIGVYKM